MRATAEVLPGNLAIAAHIVVDRQLGATDLDRSPIGALALGADEFQLVRLVSQLLTGGFLAGDPTHEALVLFDDPLHPLLELGEHLGGDGLDVAEVVVETVGDERADTQVHLGVQLLDGLCHDVGARVPNDVEPVLARRLDGLHLGAVVKFALQIDEVAVDPHGDDVTLGAEEIQTGRGGVHLLGPGGTGTVQGDADGHD